YIGLVAGVTQILERLGLIALAILALRTALRAFSIGGFAGGGAAGSGGLFAGGRGLMRAGGLTWLGVDAFQGHQEAGIHGMFMQALTGSVNPTRGDWDNPWDTALVPA